MSFFCLEDAGDWCQQRFCECDQAAIDCMTQSSYNLTLRGLAESFCSATNQTGNFIRGETGDGSLINLQGARQQSAPPAPAPGTVVGDLLKQRNVRVMDR